MTNCALTTFDNPFNPFEDFDSWLQFDNEKGYNCCGRLDRIAKVREDMSEREEMEAIEEAIDLIIKFDVLNIYRKVFNPTFKPIMET